jgi:lipopolysaccharide transport system permease protein
MENDLPVSHLPKVVYEPSRSWLPHIDWRELWHYRELLYFLTWRDVKVRYKQAALGVGWAILQPLLTMVIFSIIFGQLAKLPSENVPYPVFSFAALLPWQLFAEALSRSGVSLVMNNTLLTKVYFPRLVIPLSAVFSSLVDFAIAFVIFIGLMIAYGIQVTWAVLAIPFLVAFALLTALSVGIWLAAFNVPYRDVQYAIPFLIQVWMYASPVAYSINLIPEGAVRLLYGLNPMVGVIQGFRWALLGGQPPDAVMIVSIIMMVLLLAGGLLYFRHMEETFADVV